MDKLKSVVMILAAPRSGDGKNKDNSNLNLEVSITTDDKKVFLSTLELRENFEVKKGFWVPALMKLPNNYENITHENVESIDATVIYWKPDEGEPDVIVNKIPVSYKHDKWNARAEVVLTFESGKILSTNGSDPSVELNFAKGHQIYKPFFKNGAPLIITRGMMIDYIGYEKVVQGQGN